ncbi:hydrogenase maturation protease [Tautonia rosea]|uniref:hydrogenase maturation protease n=1 Tax=Tautonia rosea TaxID=2728037 RepID=UPI00147423FF|nr:hydrogenase maturation protease [Tautonia rosea]
MAEHLIDPTRGGKVLILGFGNVLRGDDGIGPRVAETVAGWDLCGVVALAAHQLVPEFAEPIHKARVVIFVDAVRSSNSESESVSTIPLHPRATASPLGHVSDPEQLLALARDVFCRCPPAYLIRVPASDVNLGDSLSPLAEAGIHKAFDHISTLLCEYGVSDLPESPQNISQSEMALPPSNSSTEETRERAIIR